MDATTKPLLATARCRALVITSIAACSLIAARGAAAETVEIPLSLPGDFSTTIDNPYFPLPVGTSFAYRAEADEECEYNKFTVTPATRLVEIDGAIYTVRVIRDQEWEDEGCDYIDVELVEDTQDFFAEDPDNNVFYFGEDTNSSNDEGLCSTHGSWLAGVDGAVPGVVMLGAPERGDRYQQEFLVDQAEDWGAVMRDNATVSIEFGEFEDCLETREWSPLEHGHVEHKTYCQQQGDLTPGGLTFVEELKEKTLYVEYIGTDFSPFVLPGESDPSFPSDALDCDAP